MSINNLNTYLNVRDAHLRVVSGNVYAQAMNIGGINVETAHGLQSVSNTGNATSLTLEFANVTTGFVTTANAQIGRDLVVTGNATVSKELTVTSNAIVSSNLNVSDDLIVTNNILASNNLTVTGNLNVTTIRSDSNVVAEYTGPHDRPLRKYPEVALTSASQDGYVVTQSNQDTVNSYFAYEAFNEITNTTSDIWYTGDLSHYNTSDGSATGTAPQLDSGSNTDRGEWIALELPKSIKLDSFKLWRQDNWEHHHPVSATLYAKKTSSDSWTEIYRYDDINSPTTGTTNPVTPGHFNVNSQVFYRFFAFVARKRSEGVAAVAGISLAELEYYGYEEGSGSLDTTLKSVYNVPATTGTQLEVYYDGQNYTTGTTVNDLALPANNGTLNGGVGIDPTYKAFTFDGSSSQNITSSALGFTGDQPHTFSFWIKDNEMNHTSTYVMHIGRTTHAASQNSSIEFRSDRIRWASYANDIEYPLTGITSNTWYHITGSYVGGGATPENKSLYINGKRFDDTGYNIFSGWEATAGDPLSFQSDAFVTLGSSTAIGTTHFNGSIANFRLYSKALNADQVKELYDYQKDYFLGSKSQVTLYKGHLGVGVTEPSGQLELAGDERIQEYPPRGLIGDKFVGDSEGPGAYDYNVEGHGVFKLLSSYDYHTGIATSTPDDRRIYRLFDKSNDTLTHWSSFNSSDPYDAAGGSGAWVTTLDGGSTITAHIAEIQMPYKITLKKYILTSSSQVPRALKTGMIVGSNDGNVFHVLDSVSDFGFTATYQPKEYTVDNTTTPYRIFRLLLMNTNGHQTCNMNEWRLFGTPGPTTLDKGSLTLGRSLDVPRVSRYDVDTETPRPEKLVVDFDTTVNSSPTDISGKGNHGTFNGAADYSAADKAFDFPNDVNTTNENVKITAVSPISASTDIDFSFSLWVKVATASTTGWRCIWEMGDRGYYDHFGLYIPGSTAGTNRGPDQFSFETWGQGYYPAGDTVVANRWYHVVGTYDKDTLTKALYVDGVYKNGGTITTGAYSTGPANPPLTIGSHLTGGETWAGQVSNFKVYKDATLEPSEVRKLYNLGRTGRSMVIGDTAVGIGKVPEAQLDVRGNLGVSGHITNGGPRLEICDDSTHVHGYGTAGKGVKFSHAGIVFDRTWGNYPSLGVFTENIDGTTNQGEFRIHGFDVSYSSYPGPSGAADFGVVTRSDGGYQSGSDRRMKINITTIDEALKKVCSLTGKRYQLINRNGDINKNTSQNGYNYGLIAQDIEEAGIDEIYKHNEHEDDKTENYNSAYSINYDSIIPLLINAIKEQQEVAELRGQLLNEIKGHTRELQIENNRLKNKVVILENRQTHFNTLLVDVIGRIEKLERPT